MKNKIARCCQGNEGFTLIEIMVVVAIVSILASIALPSYQQSVRKSHRSDAMMALSGLQLLQEKYRANNPSYGTLVELDAAGTSPGGYYTITVSSPTSTGYVLTATAVAGKSQASDTACTAMTLTQAGAAITYAPGSCWNQ